MNSSDEPIFKGLLNTFIIIYLTIDPCKMVEVKVSFSDPDDERIL